MWAGLTEKGRSVNTTTTERTLVAEIDELHSRTDEEAVRQRVSLPPLVTSGSHFFGGEELEDRVQNNWMDATVYYRNHGEQLMVRYNEVSLRAYHPLRGAYDYPAARAEPVPVEWEAGSWLVMETLRNGAAGKAAVHPGQEALKPVYQKKCEDFLTRYKSRTTEG